MNFYKNILSFVLCSLGFVACSSTDTIQPDGKGKNGGGTVIEEPTCEYGCPYAVYKVIGTVVNEKSEPIKGIEVKSVTLGDSKKVITDEKGGFIIEDSRAFPRQPYEIKLEDVDGKDNGGEFESVDKKVSFKDVEHIGADDKWFEGKAEKEITVIMNEKTEE